MAGELLPRLPMPDPAVSHEDVRAYRLVPHMVLRRDLLSRQEGNSMKIRNTGNRPTVTALAVALAAISLSTALGWTHPPVRVVTHTVTVTRTVHVRSKPRVVIRYRTRPAVAPSTSPSAAPAYVPNNSPPPVVRGYGPGQLPPGLPANVGIVFPAGFPNVACAEGNTYIQANGPGTPYTLDPEDPQNSPCNS